MVSLSGEGQQLYTQTLRCYNKFYKPVFDLPKIRLLANRGIGHALTALAVSWPLFKHYEYRKELLANVDYSPGTCRGANQMKNVKGKVVLITGAAMGLGKILAERFAMDGANLGLVDMNREALEETAQGITDHGVKVGYYLCDVSDRQAVYAMAGKVHEELGPVDVLVNNAGIVAGGEFLDVEDHRHLKVIEVNLIAHLWTTKAFLPDMIEKGEGHLLVISSAAGLVATAGISSYVASKFGALGFAEAIRMEVNKKGVNIPVTIVCPAFISTGMFEGAEAPWLSPYMKPEKIVDTIYKRFKKNKPYVLEPWPVKLTPFFKSVFPTRFFERTFQRLGLRDSMDTLQGR